MKKKRQQLQILVGAVAVAAIALIAIVVIIFIGKKKLDEYETTIASYELEMESNKQLVYVSTMPIKKGEKVSSNNVTQQVIYTGLEPSYYMDSSCLGMQAIADIRQNEPIMSNMVSPIYFTDDLRTYELTVAHLMSTQQENDVVDVRVMFPNGEDYVILAKKQIYDLYLGTNVFSVFLTEDEILRMSSAIVDAYTTTGARIYTTRYVEPNVQVDATPNYLVRPAIIDLINSDPNILEVAEQTLNLEARMDLDSRLGSLSEEQLTAISEGMSLIDTAQSSVIREGAAITAEGEENDSENYETVIEGGSLEDEENVSDEKTGDNSTGGELTEADDATADSILN